MRKVSFWPNKNFQCIVNGAYSGAYSGTYSGALLCFIELKHTFTYILVLEPQYCFYHSKGFGFFCFALSFITGTLQLSVSSIKFISHQICSTDVFLLWKLFFRSTKLMKQYTIIKCSGVMKNPLIFLFQKRVMLFHTHSTFISFLRTNVSKFLQVSLNLCASQLLGSA